MELTIVYGIIFLITIYFVVLIIRFINLKPSNERLWVDDNKELASVLFEGKEVIINNLRDFNWRTTRDYDVKWITKKFELESVVKIWFILEYFDPKKKQMAHTIMSFEFDDGSRITCSIEVRREIGERYHPIKGLFRKYELIYIWSTERDSIGVRTRCRKNSTTHLFEAVVLGKGNEKKLLKSYLNRTNDLYNKPEWYNTITNTCTTNIVKHVNEVYPKRVPKALAILLPGLSPKLLHKNNLVKIENNLEETLEKSIIDYRAKKWDGKVDFGDQIRK